MNDILFNDKLPGNYRGVNQQRAHRVDGEIAAPDSTYNQQIFEEDMSNKSSNLRN